MAAGSDFHALAIAQADHAPGDALVLTLTVPPALGEIFRFKPGQHIALRTTLDGEEVRRNYSICAGPSEALRVAIKRVEGGRFTSWAHAHLTVGMLLDVMPPAGRFVLAPPQASARHIVCLASGSGITPVLGIIRQALAHETQTRVTLVYGNRGRETVMFGEELEALKDQYLQRFELVSLFSRDGEAEVDLLAGRITGETVARLGTQLIAYGQVAQFFVCGPGSMIKSVREALLALGVPRERVTHEFFAAGGGVPRVKPVAVDTAGIATTEVIGILDGVRHRLALTPGQNVLDAALKAGVKPPYACQGGMCCTCRAKIIEGAAVMTHNYSLEAWEMERGFVLTCQAVPTTARLVVDWDAM